LCNSLLTSQNVGVQLNATAPDDVLGPQLDLILDLVGAGDLIEEDHSEEDDASGMGGGAGVQYDQGPIPMSTLSRKLAVEMSTLAKKPYDSATHNRLKVLFSTGKGRHVPAALREVYTKREVAIQTEQAKFRKSWGLSPVAAKK
jgi:hypothetical protein